MKKFLVLTICLMSWNAFSEDKSSAKSEKQCQAESGSKPFNSDTENTFFPGSNKLNACDKLSRGHMKTIYSAQGNRSGFNWKPHIKYACCSSDSKEKCEKDATSQAKACESVAYVLSSYGREWDNSEHNKPVGADNKASTPNAANGANAANAMAAAASIRCTSQGIETVDYESCKNFQNQLGLIEAVQMVGYGTQELVYRDKIFDSQTKHATDENTATGALKATGESLKMQQDMYQQRAAIDATKLAYLYSIYNDMPKTSEVLDKCNNLSRNSAGDLGTIEAGVCRAAVMPGQGGFAITMNQAQLDAMKAKLVSIATAAGSSMILSNLLGKRADDVNKAIAKIDAFKPVDPFTVTEDEALSSYCKMNPGQPQCLGAGLEKTFDTLNDNIITFGDGGTGTTYAGNGAITNTSAGENGSTNSDGTAVAPVGSVITAANHDNSMEKAMAATVSTKGTGSTGGGGSGGGGASGGGGGGGAPPALGNPGGVQAAVAGKTPTYGGGNGSISVVGGFGINKKQGEGKGDDNPFGKLFGKDAPKGSGVVNFRDIASVGKEKDNLFDMISKRYTKVSADKRLLEYELAK